MLAQEIALRERELKARRRLVHLYEYKARRGLLTITEMYAVRSKGYF